MSMNNVAYSPRYRPLFHALSNPFISLKHLYDGVAFFTVMQDRQSCHKVHASAFTLWQDCRDLQSVLGGVYEECMF